MPFPYEYDLPPELIAQEPIEPRDHARLLVVRRAEQRIEHCRFLDLPSLLQPGDLLVLNDTRVLHARLLGKRLATGGKWEGLFLRAAGDGTWEMLCQTRGRLQPGDRIEVEPHGLVLTMTEKLPEGRWLVRPESDEPAAETLARHGHVPLPPYIRKGQARDEDNARYQTVYAKSPGAVAAPTAGLHFTDRVFESLKQRGIEWAYVTLHVGIGTFRPMEGADPTQHRMHQEWGSLSESTAEAIRRCKERGGRVVAVGTTSVRVLETAGKEQPLRAWEGDTNLFIYPPYRFGVVDAMTTNFHLPKTTLLLMVAAFGGTELMARAYEEAIAERYRFYSYGDAMLIA
jgi:S-adenosylmethionine:tRNA ribosyltransferase-isomerase